MAKLRDWPAKHFRIIWEQPDGSVWVTVPGRPPFPDEDDSRYLAAVAAKAQLKIRALANARHVSAVHKSTLPQSRRFRNCWRVLSENVHIDVALVRVQILDEIRTERNSRLQASDGDLLRVNEDGMPQDIIAWRDYRKQLRDLPPRVESDLAALTTPEAIEQYQPPWPNRPG